MLKSVIVVAMYIRKQNVKYSLKDRSGLALCCFSGAVSKMIKDFKIQLLWLSSHHLPKISHMPSQCLQNIHTLQKYREEKIRGNKYFFVKKYTVVQIEERIHWKKSECEWAIKDCTIIHALQTSFIVIFLWNHLFQLLQGWQNNAS